jgi:hypothetical protein
MTPPYDAGLPVSGCDFAMQSPDERDAMVRHLSARSDAVVATSPAVVLIEIEAEQAVYPVTRPGLPHR